MSRIVPCRVGEGCIIPLRLLLTTCLSRPSASRLVSGGGEPHRYSCSFIVRRTVPVPYPSFANSGPPVTEGLVACQRQA